MQKELEHHLEDRVWVTEIFSLEVCSQGEVGAISLAGFCHMEDGLILKK